MKGSKSEGVISTKRGELDEICDHFSIQIENPLAFLTQDTARQFLGDTSEKEKYRLFMQGVQLDQLLLNYNILERKVDSAKREVQLQKESLQVLLDAEQKARHSLQRCRDQRTIQDQIQSARLKFAWLQTRDQETKLDEVREKIEENQAYIEDYKSEHRQALEVYTHFENKLSDKSEEYGHKQAKLKLAEAKVKDAQNNLSLKLDSLKEEQHAERSQREALQLIEIELKDVSAEVEITRDFMEKQAESTQSLLRQEEENTSGLVSQLGDQIKSKTLDRREIEQHLEQEAKNFEQVEKDLRKFEEQASMVQQRIQHQSSNDQLEPYGPQMKQLLNAISKESHFSTRPTGPLGLYIHITDEKWTGLFESFFGTSLDSFLVTTQEDARLLRSLMKRLGFQKAVHIVQDIDFNFQSGEPNQSYSTILRSLRFENDFVKRVLIDLHKIESTILIENRADADKTMYNKPEKVKACFSLKSDGSGDGFRVGGRQGGSGTAPFRAYRGRYRIRGDRRSILKILEDERLSLVNKQRQAREKQQQSKFSSQDFREKLEHLRQQITALNKQKDEYEAKLETIQINLQDGSAVRLQELKERHNEIIQRRSIIKMQFEQLILRRNATRENCNELDRVKRTKDLELKQLGIISEQAQSELESATSGRQQSVISRDHWATKLKNREEHSKTLEEEEKSQIESVGTFKRLAEQIGEKVVLDPSVTAKDMVKKIDRLNNRLRQAQQEVGNVDQMNEAYNGARLAREEAERSIKILFSLISALQRAWEERCKRWKTFRLYVSLRARLSFQYNLAIRGFSGELKLDHKQETLRLEITPTEGSEASKGGPKTLSGGEKSYAQVCLLLALWEGMGSPIRCLDEFDVYMDAVNRVISMNIMILAASDAPEKQTIFITPQDMQHQQSDDVRIFRLLDPQRNN